MKRAWHWTSAASIVTARVGVASNPALRTALERTKHLLASHGIFNMSASEHVGLDQRTRVMVQIVGSKSQLAVD